MFEILNRREWCCLKRSNAGMQSLFLPDYPILSFAFLRFYCLSFRALPFCFFTTAFRISKGAMRYNMSSKRNVFSPLEKEGENAIKLS